MVMAVVFVERNVNDVLMVKGWSFNIPQCCFAASGPRKYEDLLKTVTVERIG